VANTQSIYVYTHFTASFPGQPGKPAPERWSKSGF